MSLRRQADFAFPPFGDDERQGGSCRTWLKPVGIIPQTEDCLMAGFLPLAGGPFAFGQFDVVQSRKGAFTVTRVEAKHLLHEASRGGEACESQVRDQLDLLTRPRENFAGLSMQAWHVMGIINTTPDSFSDGGDHAEMEIALTSARQMAADGASILDVGGESTRPGAAEVSRDEERRRILPVIHALADEGICVSADTRHTMIMAEALSAGATIINDVGGLRAEGAVELVARNDAPAILMHMQGEPGTMQVSPQYNYAPTDIYGWLEDRINTAVRSGIPRHNLAVDPGFGFGKSPVHNMEIMANLALFHGLGVPVVLGVSRKSTISYFSKNEPAKERQPGSTALAALARAQGVQIFRVHDVPETMQALANAEAMLNI